MYDVMYNGQVIGSLSPGGATGRFTPAAGVDIEALKNAQRQQQQASATTAAPGTPDMSAFTTSPDYQWRVSQGEQAGNRRLAAMGRLNSGAAVKEGIRYASGVASEEFGNWYSRLASMAGLGQAATNSTANAGANMVGTNANARMDAANGRASGYLGAAQSVNNAVQGGVSNLMMQRYLSGGTTGAAPYAGVQPMTYGGYNGGGVRLT